MTAETVISLVIILICIAPIIILGIVQRKSKDPVGFWSGRKPPEKEQIRDVKTYNQKHGTMWILYGAGFILCFVGGAPFGGVTAAVLCMIEAFGGILGMIVYHNRLNRMYWKKEEDM